jgi:hypothetical protein
MEACGLKRVLNVFFTSTGAKISSSSSSKKKKD